MKVGFLPLYIELYDRVVPDQRARHTVFCDELTKKMESCGMEVVRAEICRVKAEFEAAVKEFEARDVDAIVTVHLAYSPSGESYEVLAKTKLPIIVLDTTVTNDFSDKQNVTERSYCHGVHGVMDMCCMLRRHNKPFAICAGWSGDEKLFQKLVGYVKAAASAKAFRGQKVGRIGTQFAGMEDFNVPEDVLASRFGIEVVSADPAEMKKIASQITDESIALEIAAEKKNGEMIEEIADDVFAASAKTNLVVRQWIENHGLNALTVNFLDVCDAGGLDTMPFMEACLAMERGIGYAGEGDVFTASLVGALLKNYAETSFIEIFCPDWEHDTLYISHMGEMNYAVAEKPVEFYRNNFSYGNGTPTVVGTGAFCEGKACFVNLYPTADDFGMVIAPVDVLKTTSDNFKRFVRGWIKPTVTVSEFLEQISIAGATHHSALVYNATAEELSFFAECLGVKPVIVG